MAEIRQPPGSGLKVWLHGCLLAWIVLACVSLSDATAPISHVLYDRLLTANNAKADSNIVVVAIDDEALQRLGGWPLARDHYTHLLDGLATERCRPKVLAFDLLFLDPTAQDSELARAMKGHRIVLPIEFQRAEDDVSAYRARYPVLPLATAAQEGHILAAFDSDGIVRGISLRHQGQPHLVVQMATQGAGLLIDEAADYRRFRLASQQSRYPSISLADALDIGCNAAIFKDKYVIVGVTAPSLGDRFLVKYGSPPMLQSMPGVDILANALSALVTNDLVSIAPYSAVFALGSIILAAVVGILTLWSPRIVFLASVGLCGLVFLLCYYLLAIWNVWLDPAPFLVTLPLLALLWAWRRLDQLLLFFTQKSWQINQTPITKTVPVAQRLAPGDTLSRSSQMLGHAVDHMQAEYVLLSAIIDAMPGQLAVFQHSNSLMLMNQRMRLLMESLGAHSPASSGEFFSCLGIGTEQVVQLPAMSLGEMARRFQWEFLEIYSPAGQGLKILVLSEVTELHVRQAERERTLQFLSHDIRTPIVTILSLLGRSKEIQGDTGLSGVLGSQIDWHARSVLEMADSLILNAAAESGVFTFRNEMVETLINDAIDTVHDLAVAKGQKLEMQLLDAAVFARIDTQLFVRVLSNLLGNAVKFSPAGCSIVIRMEIVALAHAGAHKSTYVRIEINNPVALATDSSPPSQTVQGFGLGFAFVDQVVAKHQGFWTQDIPIHGVARLALDIPCWIEETPLDHV